MVSERIALELAEPWSYYLVTLFSERGELFRMVKKQIALELGEPWRYCFVTVGFFSMLCVVLKD